MSKCWVLSSQSMAVGESKLKEIKKKQAREDIDMRMNICETGRCASLLIGLVLSNLDLTSSPRVNSPGNRWCLPSEEMLGTPVEIPSASRGNYCWPAVRGAVSHRMYTREGLLSRGSAREVWSQQEPDQGNNRTVARTTAGTWTLFHVACPTRSTKIQTVQESRI